MTRRNFSASTIKARLEHAGWQCENMINGARCPIIVSKGRFHCDHHNPDGLTGQPTFENARILCLPCHKVKTAIDVAQIAKAKRRAAKDVRPVTAPDRPLKSRNTLRTKDRVPKLSIAPRNIYEDAQ